VTRVFTTYMYKRFFFEFESNKGKKISAWFHVWFLKFSYLDKTHTHTFSFSEGCGRHCITFTCVLVFFLVLEWTFCWLRLRFVCRLYITSYIWWYFFTISFRGVILAQILKFCLSNEKIWRMNSMIATSLKHNSYIAVSGDNTTKSVCVYSSSHDQSCVKKSSLFLATCVQLVSCSRFFSPPLHINIVKVWLFFWDDNYFSFFEKTNREVK